MFCNSVFVATWMQCSSVFFSPAVAPSSVQILNWLVYGIDMPVPAFCSLILNLELYLKSDEQVTNLGNKCSFRHFIVSLAYMSKRSIWNDNYHPLSKPDMRLKIEITVSNFASGVLYLIQMYYLICNLAYSMPPSFLNFLYAYNCFRFRS